jgi:hypothetical protein
MSMPSARDRQVALLEIELGRRAAGCLLVESGQAPEPDGYTPQTWIARIALDALRAAGIQAHKPCAKTVRAALKAAGLTQLLAQVTTGRRVCRVRLQFDDAERTTEVVTALRPLWHDGATRVDAVFEGVVSIQVRGWWNTHPVLGGAR